MNKPLLSILLSLLFSSCTEITKEVASSFSEGVTKNVAEEFNKINRLAIDSIKLFNRNNTLIISASKTLPQHQEHLESIEQISKAIQSQNQQLDEVLNALHQLNKNESDRAVATKLLIENEEAKRLQEYARRTELKIQKALSPEYLSKIDLMVYPENIGTLSEDDWPTEIFKGLPVFAANSLIYKWKLENEKTLHSILKLLLKK